MTVTKRKPKPITAHPMFPFVTALWFAAFLSLGSFAVAPALLEGPVVALGIPEILPAAQPPLGFTVRALVAIVMMGVGGLMGYMVGRRLAGEKQEMPVRNRAFGRVDAVDAEVAQPFNTKQAGHRRPLNPIEDLGEPSVAGEFTLTDDLRADDAAPFAEPLPAIVETARLPWDDDFGLQRSTFVDDEARHEAETEDALAPDLLFDDADAVAGEEVADEPERDSYQSYPPFAALAEAVAEDALAEHAIVEEALTPELCATDEIPAPAAPLVKAPLLQAPAAPSLPLARTPLHELGLVQLTERLALAIGRRNARAAATQQAPAAPYAVPAAEPFAAPAASESAPAKAQDEAAPFAVAAPQPAFAPASAIPRFHSAQADADAPAQVSDLSTERVVQLRPAALQTFLPEADAFDEDDVPGLDRFLRAPAPVQTFDPAVDLESEALDENDEEDVAVWDEGDDTVEGSDARYPSLLDMGAGSRRSQAHGSQALHLSHDDDDEEDDGEAATDDLEPVVVFPGQLSPLQAAARPFDGPSAMATAAPSASSSIVAMAGSPLAAPGRAAPSSPIDPLDEIAPATDGAATEGAAADAEEADRALRAALATLQRMTAQG